MIRMPLIALALLGNIALLANAARLDPVVVRGGALRGDVDRACPGLVGALKGELAGQLPYTSVPVEAQIEFELQGSEVKRVAPVAMPQAYAGPVQQAVQGLNCQADAQAHQRYGFILNIVNDDTEQQQVTLRRLDGERLAAR